MAGTFDKPEVVQEELDILLVGGGMACCGTAYEIMRWAEAVKAETGKDLKIKLVDKAALDRSGAVAMGLSAINTYIGDKQDPADYARMVSNDLMTTWPTMSAATSTTPSICSKSGACPSGKPMPPVCVTTAPMPSRKASPR
jgi:succinate dehydrogenase/fumarate reductase flavoprotein subunit